MAILKKIDGALRNLVIVDDVAQLVKQTLVLGFCGFWSCRLGRTDERRSTAVWVAERLVGLDDLTSSGLHVVRQCDVDDSTATRTRFFAICGDMLQHRVNVLLIEITADLPLTRSK